MKDNRGYVSINREALDIVAITLESIAEELRESGGKELPINLEKRVRAALALLNHKDAAWGYS